MPIRNNIQLRTVLSMAFTNAIDFALEKAYNELVKIVELRVYTTATDMASHTLLDAWKQLNATRTFVGAKGSINFNQARMENDPDNWVHGSRIHDDPLYADVRAYIIDIIEDGYYAYGNKSGKLIRGREFWDTYIAKMDKQIPKWFAQGLRKQGLVVF